MTVAAEKNNEKPQNDTKCEICVGDHDIHRRCNAGNNCSSTEIVLYTCGALYRLVFIYVFFRAGRCQKMKEARRNVFRTARYRIYSIKIVNFYSSLHRVMHVYITYKKRFRRVRRYEFLYTHHFFIYIVINTFICTWCVSPFSIHHH